MRHRKHKKLIENPDESGRSPWFLMTVHIKFKLTIRDNKTRSKCNLILKMIWVYTFVEAFLRIKYYSYSNIAVQRLKLSIESYCKNDLRGKCNKQIYLNNKFRRIITQLHFGKEGTDINAAYAANKHGICTFFGWCNINSMAADLVISSG